MNPQDKYTAEVRENEEGEEYTLLLDSEGNEIASHWGDDDLEDFADEIAKNEAAQDKQVERTQHTPGPWTISQTSNGFLVSHKTRSVAAVDGLDLDEQVEADARLIAAAPRMYSFVASKADSGDAEAMQIIEEIRNASR